MKTTKNFAEVIRAKAKKNSSLKKQINKAAAEADMEILVVNALEKILDRMLDSAYLENILDALYNSCQKRLNTLRDSGYDVGEYFRNCEKVIKQIGNVSDNASGLVLPRNKP
jgi:hypothetical protein